MTRSARRTRPSVSPASASATLTPRQVQILRLIRDYRHSHGCSPTLQELAGKLRVSKVTVFEHVAALVQKGLLHRRPNRARSLMIDPAVELGDTEAAPRSWGPDDRADTESSGGGGYPLVGTIAAGTPLDAVENPDFLDLNNLFRSDQDTFALRVRGESMIQEQICDGDYVLVKKGSCARNGEIVVALLDSGEATLKKVFREGRRYRLEGANPEFKPIHVDQLQIQGTVIGVIRRY